MCVSVCVVQVWDMYGGVPGEVETIENVTPTPTLVAEHDTQLQRDVCTALCLLFARLTFPLVYMCETTAQ